MGMVKQKKIELFSDIMLYFDVYKTRAVFLLLILEKVAGNG